MNYVILVNKHQNIYFGKIRDNCLKIRDFDFLAELVLKVSIKYVFYRIYFRNKAWINLKRAKKCSEKIKKINVSRGQLKDLEL